MIFNNDFSCPNGHQFKANAKLRARCPECGAMAKRPFTPAKSDTPTQQGLQSQQGLESTTPVEDKVTVPISTVTILKRGKPKVMAARKKAEPPLPPKKSVVKKPPIGSAGAKLVSKKQLSGVHKPKMTGKPPRTAVARHISNPQKSYSDEMIEKYGWTRR